MSIVMLDCNFLLEDFKRLHVLLPDVGLRAKCALDYEERQILQSMYETANVPLSWSISELFD